eukprot:4220229-Prymnesium_polylepis.1
MPLLDGLDAAAARWQQVRILACSQEEGERVPRRVHGCGDPVHQRRYASSGQEAERVPRKEQQHAPVSYTHLTLPTICSV